MSNTFLRHRWRKTLRLCCFYATSMFHLHVLGSRPFAAAPSSDHRQWVGVSSRTSMWNTSEECVLESCLILRQFSSKQLHTSVVFATIKQRTFRCHSRPEFVAMSVDALCKLQTELVLMLKRHRLLPCCIYIQQHSEGINFRTEDFFILKNRTTTHENKICCRKD